MVTPSFVLYSLKRSFCAGVDAGMTDLDVDSLVHISSNSLGSWKASIVPQLYCNP